jgi:hypothetical protein
VKSLAEKQYRLEIDGEIVTCNLELKARVLAKTSMKYSSITLSREKMLVTRDDLSTYHYDLPEARFIDSNAFLSCSLEKLVKDLAKQTKDSGQCLKTVFPATWAWIKQDFPSVAEDLFALSTEKGLIAYNHTTVENMASKTNLSIECYKSDLDLTDGYLARLEEADPDLATQLRENEAVKRAELEKDYARTNKVYDLLAREYGEDELWSVLYVLPGARCSSPKRYFHAVSKHPYSNSQARSCLVYWASLVLTIACST